MRHPYAGIHRWLLSRPTRQPSDSMSFGLWDSGLALGPSPILVTHGGGRLLWHLQKFSQNLDVKDENQGTDFSYIYKTQSQRMQDAAMHNPLNQWLHLSSSAQVADISYSYELCIKGYSSGVSLLANTQKVLPITLKFPTYMGTCILYHSCSVFTPAVMS